MLTKEEKEKLSENGKNEVLEVVVGDKSAVLVISFAYIKKGLAELIETKITRKGKDSQVNVTMKPIEAGDLLLFQCWHSGDEELKSQAKLRFKACKQIGDWIQQFADEGEEIEKKN